MKHFLLTAWTVQFGFSDALPLWCMEIENLLNFLLALEKTNFLRCLKSAKRKETRKKK